MKRPAPDTPKPDTPRKRHTSKVSTEPAPPQPPKQDTKEITSHPTLGFIAEDLAVVADELRALDKDPLPFAGVGAYAPAEFTARLFEDGAYECTLTFSHFAALGFVFGAENPCTIGSIMRIYEGVMLDPQTGKPAPNIQFPIKARAATPDSHPIYGEVQRLNNDSYFFAFLHGWAEAKKQGLLEVVAKFNKAARSIKCRFEILPDHDELERQKWRSVEDANSMADNQRLFGSRKALAVIRVRDDLDSRGKGHTAKDVADWFKTVSFHDENMTKSVAERYLRVGKRLVESPSAKIALDMMESIRGAAHYLSNVSTLDQIFGATSCSPSTLQATITEWVVEGLCVLQLRSPSSGHLNRDGVKQLVLELILKRKIVQHLASKFKFMDVTKCLLTVRGLLLSYA